MLKWIESWLSHRKQRVVLNGQVSEWGDVVSGVPQGSVLGPILFIIFINDLDENVMAHLSKFADDTKLGTEVATPEQRLRIQEDLKRVECWAQKWQMEFNLDKCKVMHVGFNNDHQKYYLEGQELKPVDQEKDLGVIISSDLKAGKQCQEAAKKANKMLGMISRTIAYKTPYNITKLYNAFVRPHLEYCVQFWSPHYRKDITSLEKVQRRATKLIPALRRKSYEDRLRELKLFSLEFRRHRGDMIEVWKIMTGKENIRKEDLFVLDDNSRTRNNGFKLKGKRLNLEITGHFFTHRVINEWNRLPADVVNAETLNTFKSRFDKFHIARAAR